MRRKKLPQKKRKEKEEKNKEELRGYVSFHHSQSRKEKSRKGPLFTLRPHLNGCDVIHHHHQDDQGPSDGP